jgi:integrase
MPTQLPSGRWRPRIRHPRTGKQLNPQIVIGGPPTFETEASAKAAEVEAVKALRVSARAGVTVREFWLEWTSDPMWQRPAESTNLHNAERTRRFVERYGDRPIRSIDDDVVREYRRSGRVDGTVGSLKTMFFDAARADAGRLVERNPFAGLRIARSKGRAARAVPDAGATARLIETADRLCPPSFAAWLDVAVHEGMRPGELDALRWADLDFTPGAETISVVRQFNAKTRQFTVPKHGSSRAIAMTAPARDRLLELPRESELVFVTVRGRHYTPSTRIHHWNRVRCAVGLADVELYLATRHAFTAFAWNVLELSPEDIAQHLGHQDGGELVRRLYGHFDQGRARDRVRAAFTEAPAAPDAVILRITAEETADSKIPRHLSRV